ncbi:phage-related protein (TIGR01555 family) [Rhizobium pisi]
MGIRNWFGRLFRQDKQQEVAVPAPVLADKPKPIKVPDGALISSRLNPEAYRRVPVFSLPTPAPGVLPAGETGMAMDSGIGSANNWANQFAIDGYWTEGITFLGYAYLSELAQRPEYRVISETIATEMTREWIEFFSTTDDDDDKQDRIKELEEEFKRLCVSDMFARAAQQDGFFGRGHIYIDTGDTDNTDELQKSLGDGWDELSKTKLSKKKIRSLRTIEAVWCYPTSYNSNDPLKDNWYRPDSWYVQAKIVHSSRLITLIGREVPDLLKPTYSFGGLSLSQMAKPYVDNWLQTRQSVNDIISAFSVFVLETNLAESLQADGQQLFKRAELFNNLRDNRGLMMIDKESEGFQNVSAPLGGLSELQAQAQEHMASVSHIPTVKLLGIQPAGLNASSEDQMRVFYDYIHAYQEHLFRHPLRRLMGLIMISLWGETDKAIDFRFKPLFSLDEKSEAEVEKLKAETDQILIDTGVISPEESRKRVAADPASGHSSIDVDDAPDLLDEEEHGLAPKGGKLLPGLGEEDTDDSASNRLFGKAEAA